jgi:hypothetical protein
MLMQEAKVRSSAGSTFDRIHAYVVAATSAFECSTALLVLIGACAHTQKCVKRAQVRDNKEKAQELHSTALPEPDFPETM